MIKEHEIKPCGLTTFVAKMEDLREKRESLGCFHVVYYTVYPKSSMIGARIIAVHQKVMGQQVAYVRHQTRVREWGYAQLRSELMRVLEAQPKALEFNGTTLKSESASCRVDALGMYLGSENLQRFSALPWIEAATINHLTEPNRQGLIVDTVLTEFTASRHLLGFHWSPAGTRMTGYSGHVEFQQEAMSQALDFALQDTVSELGSGARAPTWLAIFDRPYVVVLRSGVAMITRGTGP